jgi:hypothetical protein
MAGALSNLLVQAAFAPLFDDYQLFEYVGERERLWKDLESPMRRLLAGVFSDVSAIFKAKTGFPLDEALKALKDEQQQRALITKLHPPHKRLKSKRSYFPTVQVANPANPPLLPAEARLPGTAVCVEGCLMHSSVLFHYYPQARPQLADASAWLMTDGPPHLLASGRFTGELLLLNFETPGRANRWPQAVLDRHWLVPLCESHRLLQGALGARLPALSVATVESRPPKAYLVGGNALESRLRAEFTPGPQPQLLTDLTDRITGTYLAPLISKRAQPTGFGDSSGPRRIA